MLLSSFFYEVTFRLLEAVVFHLWSCRLNLVWLHPQHCFKSYEFVCATNSTIEIAVQEKTFHNVFPDDNFPCIAAFS